MRPLHRSRNLSRAGHLSAMDDRYRSPPPSAAIVHPSPPSNQFSYRGQWFYRSACPPAFFLHHLSPQPGSKQRFLFLWSMPAYRNTTLLIPLISPSVAPQVISFIPGSVHVRCRKDFFRTGKLSSHDISSLMIFLLWMFIAPLKKFQDLLTLHLNCQCSNRL